MARIVEANSGTTTSFKVTIPKDLAKEFIEKNGKEISIKKHGKGFKIMPIDTIAKQMTRDVDQIAKKYEVSKGTSRCYLMKYYEMDCESCSDKETCKLIHEGEI